MHGNLLNFAPKTSGEHLFKYVATLLNGRQAIQQTMDLPLISIGGRQIQYANYFFGVYAWNIVTRLIKMADRLNEDPVFADDKVKQKQMMTYLVKQVELPPAKAFSDKVARLAALAIKASESSGRRIASSVKESVAASNVDHYCYICGKTVTTNDGSLEYEHIWPSAFGGDSIAENLLPACFKCNRKKSAMLFWQDSNIHSFTLRPNPEDIEFRKIKREERIALHRLAIFSKASDLNISLKQAAMDIGPANFSRFRIHDKDDSVDFFNLAFEGI